MARHGIKGVIGECGAGGAADKTIRAWQEALKRQGRKRSLAKTIGLMFHIADTEGASRSRGNAVLRSG